jgi:hypothetical protein
MSTKHTKTHSDVFVIVVVRRDFVKNGRWNEIIRC